MKTLIFALLGAIMAGCGTPSVHPIYSSEDKPLIEPALVGTWKQADADTTYTVTRDGEAYRMVVTIKDAGASSAKEYPFAMRLVRIGDRNFADFAAVPKDRDAVNEKWGPLFVPTHLFTQWVLEGDIVTARMLDREWLERTADGKQVTLAYTKLNRHTLLITAETKDLQAFLKEHGKDQAAFSGVIRLERQKN